MTEIKMVPMPGADRLAELKKSFEYEETSRAPETKKQYLLEVQFPDTRKRGGWQYGAFFDLGGNAHYYATLEDAYAGLMRLLKKFNQDFEYDADGKRRETFEIGGGFGADMVSDKRTDDMSRIVAWRIRVREVTPWDLVDSCMDLDK